MRPADKALFMAIENNDVTGVKCLLTQHSKHSINNINYYNCISRTTPLILALEQRNVNERIVSLLLHHGADPNIPIERNNKISIALHKACYGNRNVNVIQMLLQFKANVNNQDSHGHTAFHLLMKLYMTGYDSDHDNTIRCTRLLLDNHANVNCHDMHGMTCLFDSIKGRGEKKLDILRLLLNSKEDDVNYQLQKQHDHHGGDTILHGAVKEKNLDIVKLIMECCATHINLFLQNKNHETPYDIAQRLQYKSIMECLKMTFILRECHLFLRHKWIHM